MIKKTSQVFRSFQITCGTDIMPQVTSENTFDENSNSDLTKKLNALVKEMCELKKTIVTKTNDNVQLSNKLHDMERRNDELSKSLYHIEKEILCLYHNGNI